MDKETSYWLRKTGFDEDRGYLHVWQYRTNPIRLSDNREAIFCFELAQEGDQYSMCVSLEARGTVPENYSEGSVWLFTDKGKDVKVLFAKCNSVVVLFGCGVKDTAEAVSSILSK